MLDENGVSNKYVVLLFSVLALFVIGTLVIEFNILDLLYFFFVIFIIIRYIKIRITKE